MNFESIVFFVFAAIMVFAALRVITARNPVHAALWLVLSFFTAAAIWLLLRAEFLAIALVLVYVGAVMVLFLFVVMMLDVDVAPLREGFVRFLPVGGVVAIVMLIEMLALMGITTDKREIVMSAVDPAVAAGTGNIGWIARALFSDYMLPFEIAAVILTVALIAAIVLTLRRRTGVKQQDPARQVMVKRGDRVRLVSMPAVDGSTGTAPAEQPDTRETAP